MKVLTSKIVNGKKMFLIEDNNPQGKVFAQDGKPIKKENISNYNPYYVDVKGLNASESTKTNLTPATKITPQEIKKIKESPTNVGNIKIKEAQEKAQRLKEAEGAYKKRKAGAPITPELLAQETQAIGDKISLQNIPGVGQYIPDMLDVTGGLGSMASNLGALPLNLNRGNYGQAALSVAMPLGVGALAGIGNPNTGQFANNLINPFAGTGDLINKLGNKYLPNAYKLNPYAFKPNPEAFYRQVGKSAYDDAITKGKVFSKGQENMLERVPELNYLDEYNKSITLDKTGKFNLTKPSEAPFVQKGELFFPINRKPTGKGYKGTKYADAEYLLEGKLPNEAVLPRYQEKYFPTLEESSNVGVIRPEFNELNNFNVYKKDWLKGYKEVPKPKSNFKSEINWGKWNKEIPNNPQLIKEYNAIEQTSKANGTWMKNPDGSVFKGTPEQFVQQNSENFKKAFPKGYDKVYRGGNNETLENRPHPIVFTGDKATAQYYTGSSDFANTVATPTQESGRVLFDLYHPKSNNSIVINNQGKSWREIPRKYFGDNPPSRDLHNSKGDFTSTDDIAKWMVENDKNSVRINNIFDSYDADFVNIINHKQGNYLKSAVGNNGMFDMTNPNIYKTVAGALATGTLGKNAMKKKEFGGKIQAKLGTMAKIRRTTQVPISKAESEFYRTFSNAKGLGRGFVTYDHSPQSGWLHTTPKGETFYSSDEYDENNKPTPWTNQDSPMEWTDSYDENKGLGDNNDGYHMKYQDKTGRNYYDVSRDFPIVTPDKWNTAKFAFAPFFLKGGDNGGWMYNTVDGGNNPMILPDGDFKKKRMLMEDIYKYNLSNPYLSRREAWKESKQFVNKEVMPLVHSDYYKHYKQGIDLGRVDAVHNNVVYQELPEKKAYKTLVDFNKRFRKMNTKDAKVAAKDKEMEFGGTIKVINEKEENGKKFYLIEADSPKFLTLKK